MKFLLKLITLVAVIVVALPLVAPTSPFSSVINAAIEDVTSFCDRRPEACHQSAAIARQTGDLLVRTLSDLSGEALPNALTVEDRALTPPTMTARDRKEAFAGHGEAPRY